MASKVKAEKFDKTNKSTIKGKVGHSRTGACRKPAGSRCDCPRQDKMGS